jgi:hypothetical protein
MGVTMRRRFPMAMVRWVDGEAGWGETVTLQWRAGLEGA